MGSTQLLSDSSESERLHGCFCVPGLTPLAHLFVDFLAVLLITTQICCYHMLTGSSEKCVV